MKYTLARFFLLVSIVGFPFLTTAATVGVAENFSLKKDQTISGDFYAIGANTTVVGEVFGDVFATGATVFVGSSSTDSILVVANKAHIVSTVKEDLRVAARSAYIGSTVFGDAAIAAFFVELLPKTVIEGDLLVAAGRVEIQGKILGNAKIAAGQVFINESISGDVHVTSDSLALGPNAIISGKLTYSASEPAHIEEGALVEGEIEFRQLQTRTRAEKFLPTIWGTWIIVRFAILLLFALAAHGILRNISNRFITASIEKPWWNFLKGFLVLVAVPIAAFIGLLTFIGIPFSLFALSLYGIVVILAAVYAPIVLGSVASMIMRRSRGVVVNWKTIVLGVALVTVFGFIPVLGKIVWYVSLFVVLGGIYQVIFDKFVEVR